MTAIFVSVKPEETRMGLVLTASSVTLPLSAAGRETLLAIFTEAVYQMLSPVSRLPLSILMWGKMGS